MNGCCDDDRRGFFARLTPAGRVRLEQARPLHLAGVRRRFLSHFDDRELQQLGAAWERVLPGAASE